MQDEMEYLLKASHHPPYHIWCRKMYRTQNQHETLI